MKEYFFLLVGGGVILAIIGLGVWQVLKALYSVYEDWRLGKELDELEANQVQVLAARKAANAERLANGCQHTFYWSNGAEPRHICSKCGLEAERPAGDCDHIWHQGAGPVPNSYCSRCDMELSGSRVGIARAS